MLTRSLRELLSAHRVFVDDAREVARLLALACAAVVEGLDLARLRGGDDHLAGGLRPMGRGTHLQPFVERGDRR